MSLIIKETSHTQKSSIFSKKYNPTDNSDNINQKIQNIPTIHYFTNIT